jgi:hypothetical protein
MQQKSNSENKVGTNIESLARISGEYFCVSGGYGGGDFFELFFDPACIEFPALILADQPRWFGDCATEPACARSISEKLMFQVRRSNSDPQLSHGEVVF